MTTEYKRAAKAALSFSKPLPDAKLRVISLGAGVQSSVMALMAAKGEVGPIPDCAIFADTQWEPKEVYTHLDWLETQLPFPVYRVTAGNIREDHLEVARNGRAESKMGTMPFFIKNAGIGRRQCTSTYKIDPVRKKVRELLGVQRKIRVPKNVQVEMWMGISTDEIQRLKEARDKWMVHRWPLIEAGMSRNDCLQWFFREHGQNLPSSSCVGCPFHSNAEWRRIRDNMPEAFQNVVGFEKEIIKHGFPGYDGAPYLHRSCVPLDEVDLSTAADKGQHEFGFLEECEGMCGI